MGVDYDGVGGMGILFTEEMAEKCIESGFFAKEEWEDDQHECMEKFKLSYSPAGNSYSGRIYFYLMVDGETLKEINENALSFLEKINKAGFNFSINDLKVISDVHIW